MNDSSSPHTRFFSIARALWIVLSLTIAAVTIYRSTDPGNRDNDIVMVFLMIALSFPSAYLAALMLFVAARWSHGALFEALGHYPNFLIEWLAFFVVGYLQWFVVVPALVRKIRERRQVRGVRR